VAYFVYSVSETGVFGNLRQSKVSYPRGRCYPWSKLFN
jgi:hypothetical protein